MTVKIVGVTILLQILIKGCRDLEQSMLKPDQSFLRSK